jgi:SSS family solute:Na+ symporter
MWLPNNEDERNNQFIVQRTLASKSLAQGQNGLLFGAVLKLTIPFIIILPGIMAFQLYGTDLPDADQAFPFMVGKLLPAGLRGVVLAALLGAVMSSLDSVLNSAATLFTMDIYKRCFHRHASSGYLVRLGRIVTFVFLIFGCLVAPLYADSGGIFMLMKRIGAAAMPGAVSVFLFGLFVPRVPAFAGVAGLLVGPVIYLTISRLKPDMAFVNTAGIATAIILAMMTAATLLRPADPQRRVPADSELDLTPSPHLKWAGTAIVVVTALLYVVFR